ncbi:hypothetical protein V5E97_19730 [Singulisphaera sp. Ch08]|uniref:Fibronectin type-III domain-containing protein n=1 Tax=Singulisphaera sp. Ch08 TaxID=3120278 RepID=A0AAU7CT25_9BACT
MRLTIAGLVLTFALGIGTHPTATAQAPPSSKGPTTIYHKSRSFRVPFQINPAERARRRELQLWISDDQGRHWKQQGVTTPDRPAFTFNTEHDGEYWLAVRSVDEQGRLFPADDVRIEPSMKIVVDTKPPSIVLDPLVRSASLASVRWEVRDDHPDPHPPVLEYQVEGQKEWHPVPLDAEGTPGVATWDSGYAQPLQVRVTALDLAGNKSEKILILGSSRPGQSTVIASTPPPETATEPEPVPATATARTPQPESGPKPSPSPDLGLKPESTAMAASQGGLPVRQSSARPSPQLESRDNLGQGVTKGFPESRVGQEALAAIHPSAQDIVHQASPHNPAPAAIEPHARDASSLVTTLGGAPFATQITSAPLLGADSLPEVVEGGVRDAAGALSERELTPGQEASRRAGLENPVTPLRALSSRIPSDVGADPGVGMAALAKPAGTSRPSEVAVSNPTNKLKVPGPRFLLDYAVDRAGPDGRPAVVEIWVTEDGGKTWSRQGKDADRVSPVLVELNGEGTFGISLIARDADGLGDKPPAPGDEPKLWIEVEPQSSPPPSTSRASSLLQRALRR